MIKKRIIYDLMKIFSKNNWRQSEILSKLFIILKRKIYTPLSSKEYICIEILGIEEKCLLIFINTKFLQNDIPSYMNIIEKINVLLINEKYFDFSFIIFINRSITDVKNLFKKNINNIYIAQIVEFESILSHTNPIEQLLKIAEKIKIHSQISPFHYLGPCSPNTFVGRNRIIKEILYGPVNAHAIYGGRHTGKSSLLLKIKDEILTKKSLACKYLPLYIDCTQFTTHNDLELEIIRKTSPNLFHRKSKQLFNFQQSLQRSAAINEKNILILLDQYDNLINSDNKYNYTNESFFNSIISIVNEGSIKLVICGFKELYQMLNNKEHPARNMMIPITLEMLTLKEVSQLVLAQFSKCQYKVANAQHFIKNLYEMTNGYPSFVNLICKELFYSCTDEKIIHNKLLFDIVQHDNILKYIENIFLQNTDSLDRLICFFAIRYNLECIKLNSIFQFLFDDVGLNINDRLKFIYDAFNNLVYSSILIKVSKNEYTFINQILVNVLKNNIFSKERYNLLIERVQNNYGSNKRNRIKEVEKIIKSIEFPPEYKQAGMSILNYFGQVLQTKYPNTEAKIQIIQDGLLVKLIIDPVNEGDVKVIEKTLQEYGLVITNQSSPEALFPDDPLQVMALKNKLEITALELRQTRQLLSLSEKNNEINNKNLKNEILWLRKNVGELLKSTGKEKIQIEIKQEMKNGNVSQQFAHGDHTNVSDGHSVIFEGKTMKGNIVSGNERI